MKHSTPLTLAILFGTSCGGAAKPATTSEPAMITDHGKRLADARAPIGRTWRAGMGVEGCELGATLDACAKALGPPTRDDDNATFGNAGVRVHVIDGRIAMVMVLYRSDTASPFVGSDPQGIGAKATPDAVVHAYGPPAGSGGRVVSEFGSVSRGQTLEYPDRGLSLTFYDGNLSHVVIGSKPNERE